MPLKIDEIIPLPTSGNAAIVTSTVCEPSLSCFGNTILYTGNWFAFKSTDKGKNWKYLDPETFFPRPNVDFSCDQSVIHDPSRKLTFWILQYDNDSNGENVLRIAVNNSPSLKDDSWYWWDLKPGANSTWKKQWFDFNHAALSDNYLYVGTNMYDVDDRWKRCIIFRMSLDKLADPKSSVKYNFYSKTKNGSLRCTLGAKKIMYFASPNSDHSLKVFEWPEKSTKVKSHIVNITPFTLSASHKANCPDGNNWLKRCDDRITASWVSNDILGFMWTVGKQKNRPFPFVKCARMDAKNFKLLDEPDIWSDKFAYAYADVCPNDQGKPGITLFRGGGQEFPDHLIGVFDEDQKQWDLALAKNGTDAPEDLKWGDYLTCRKNTPNGKSWVASGFVLNGGGTRKNVKPILVYFSD